MASHSTQAIASGDLVDLVSSSGSATIYPSDDAILAVLQARFRADLPYTRLGSSNLVVVNPYKTLANVNDISAREYEERCYKDTSLPMVDSPKPLQPHLYDLAARVYLLMRRKNASQAVLTRGITASGKSTSLRLLTSQLLLLSTHSAKEAKIAAQIKALSTVLDSFGNAKTTINANASKHSRYVELHFSDRGRIASAKVLTWGLDKSRLNRLANEERSFHVFYQLIAGATTTERDTLNIDDPSEYALLASSGTYRLPSGPFSDDAIAMSDLRSALRTLGFKPKSTSAIFTLLIAILLLGNLTFGDGDASDVSAYVSSTQTLEQVSRLLGVSPDDLGAALTMKTSYVRKEVYTVLLNAQQSSAQRDRLVRDLYAILFAFVVESINHKVGSTSAPHTQVILLDQPGFSSRSSSGSISLPSRSSSSFSGAPLINAFGNNTFEEFTVNFAEELLHSYSTLHTFDDSVGWNGQMVSDGVALPAIATMDNSACVELLRGAGVGDVGARKPGGILGVLGKAANSFKSGKGNAEHREEDLLQDLVTKFGVHASFITSPSPSSQDRHLFGINHFSAPTSYTLDSFIENDADMLDAAFVPLFKGSSEPLVAKLFSGPSLAVERHGKDTGVVVLAQVSSRPLRSVTPIAGSDPVTVDLDPSKPYPVTTQLNATLTSIFSQLSHLTSPSSGGHVWTLSHIRPNDSSSPNSFNRGRVKAQIRSLLLPDTASRLASADYATSYGLTEFCDRYVPTMRGSEAERITQCARANGWNEGSDYVVGKERVWVVYSAWKGVEDGVRSTEKDVKKAMRDGGMGDEDDEQIMPDDATEYTAEQGLGARGGGLQRSGSGDNLLDSAPGHGAGRSPYGQGGLHTPNANQLSRGFADNDEGEGADGAWGSDYDLVKKSGSAGGAGTPPYPTVAKEGGEDGGLVVKEASNAVEEVPSSRSRRTWLWLVWACTWYMPSFLLAFLGRMKRPDIRLAWREKVTIFFLIFILNCLVIFWVVAFGRLLCPNFDVAWNQDEVAQHTGDSDWWVSVQGRVYDLSNFIHGDHTNGAAIPSNGADTLEVVAGTDMTYYFPIPLFLGCPDLVTDRQISLTIANTTTNNAPLAIHVSGPLQSDKTSALYEDDWYTADFRKKMDEYYKGPLVWEKKVIESYASDTDIAKIWAVYDSTLYDLTDYVNSITVNPTDNSYSFLDSDITDVFKQRAGQDITEPLNKVLDAMDTDTQKANKNCLSNVFSVGKTDFRKTARCEAQNYVLLIMSGILMASMGMKFLAALQLGSKRNPELQDKFVLCQVPCYTEGEDSLRRTIDSLSALNYDDKRKLIFIICDGNIIGSGNDRTTPRIVLDILGVDPKLDPEPLLFKSVGEGSKALNYGKVYSGLYEFEGHVVPYMVIVKVGKPTERSKPGNRGKRDSQILLLHYLNRVHFDAPMSPLELEIYHQMRNVIGIDPAFYEYIFTVDADTTVTPDSLNRLVASSADDSSIIGICGETKLENQEASWWTMIQVYEYYISHHLSKAFESLFGSVTCLPGCFSLYRIRTSDKGRPILISNRVIDEYSEPNVDTLHKKNLFSLGEDRFLTTLLMKHFPTFKTKFCPDAIAHTVAPDSWRILFSQRRRWINSTIHNLCELVMLPELFGFCCFSMRFFVFIDLLGTLILPATVVYLVYLIITVATGNAAFPRLAIIMLAVVYGLQAIIFILKREFMLIGWMVVYILSYPVYSFFLPVYSFWCMDEFGWGNTRLVIGEGKEKKVIMNEDEKFDDSMIPLKKFSEYEAEAWESNSRHSDDTGYDSKSRSRSRPPPSRAESPHTYAHASQSGDYYRDTNLTYNSNSNPNLRLGSQLSLSNLSHHGPPQQFAPPQIPLMPFGGGPGSAMGSEYGHPNMGMPQMGYQNTGSMYGMMPPAGMPRNTMMSNFNMGGAAGSFGGGSQSGQSAGYLPPMAPRPDMQRPMSTFSMGTSVNAFAGPNLNPNPTDDELFNALRNYLSTQDLMTVTKKTAREAIGARFPKADLVSRKDFLNRSIDSILSES